MGADRSQDELARTATAPGSGSATATPAAPLGDTLGRYRLERTLGEGGMGVVHAAFDPDLERRVALKVLRSGDDAGEARQRLLREARAMARLTHANVVTVHEVGSVNGRDYVAMELIDGETLAEWLAAAPRAPDEILAAFLAAGRGLAAAHAAGLVHRDFKPHNVLRRRDGRIVVTDFGLARETASATALDTTVRLGRHDDTTAQRTPSALSGLTVTGSVLGTPAYMSPEQWSGGTVGPPADQFAYCVALWEALTGERPFRGDTIDVLKAAVLRGPDALDASKLPRAVRAPLRRGLDPDPAKRWPSMDALLAALRPGRRRGALLAAGGVALVALAAGGYAALGHAHARTPHCAPPALDPAMVWSPSRARALGGGLATAQLDAAFARWQSLRGAACHEPASERAPRLQCFDGVLAWLDVAARAAEATRDVHGEPGALLVDPEVCTHKRVPRLIGAATPALHEVASAWLRDDATPQPMEPFVAAQLVAHAESDACAAALADVLAARAREATPLNRRRHLEDADSAAQTCGDERILADVAVASAGDVLADRRLGDELRQRVKRAEGLIANVAQPDLTAQIEELRATVARRVDLVDQAIAHADAAAAHYAERLRIGPEILADLDALDLRELRGRPDDLAAVPRELATWRALAVDKLGATADVVRSVDISRAGWTFATGDDAAAHRAFEQLRRPSPDPHEQHITGRVVDATGAPVAGALVAAAVRLIPDSMSITYGVDGSLRTATTRADGTFELPDAPPQGAIAAELGDRRSAAAALADGLTLVLAPTATITGKVALHGEPATKVTIVVRSRAQPATVRYGVLAPVHADGSFTIRGVPRGADVISAVVETGDLPTEMASDVDVTGPSLDGVAIDLPVSKRTLQVIVRSTVGMAIPNAQVFVAASEMPAVTNALAVASLVRNVKEQFARPLDNEHAPAAVLAKGEPGDMYATITQVPEGTASACGIALPADLADPALARKLSSPTDGPRALAKIEVRCVPVGPHDDVVIIEVPPWPRLD